ncbi:MAG TPA: NAD-dependent epimerase/dehydratase family protein [Myxococcota bacterium]|nr:NAD-dependent epimerase/dehydratase family protein [Myxococcota bacterium]
MGRVAVTGANGFVGARVVRALALRGHEPVALVGADVGRESLAELAVETRELDLVEPKSVSAALAGCDAVIHTAARYEFWARDPREIYRVNVDGTRHVLTAARELGLHRIVYTSTGATLAPQGHGFAGHYRASKAQAEALVDAAARAGAHAVVVHPTSVLGPGDRRPTPTGSIIVHFLCGRMKAFLDMQQNAVHVDDVAVGHVAALERGDAGAHYVLGGDNLRMRELLALLAELTGLPAPRLALPLPLVHALGAVNEWLADRVTGRPPLVTREAALHARDARPFDTSRARAELGFAPRGAREVLADAVRWFAREPWCPPDVARRVLARVG